MSDHEQLLIDATSRYFALLGSASPPSVGEFVAAADPALREDLAAFLEFALAVGAPPAPFLPTPGEQASLERAATRAGERMRERVRSLAPRTLTAARVALRLSSASLARQVDLPVDLLVRIERGGVRAPTIPRALVARLAAALQQTEAELRALLAAPAPAPAGLRLRAEDGVVARADPAVDFAVALRASSATPAQRAAWESAEP